MNVSLVERWLVQDPLIDNRIPMEQESPKTPVAPHYGQEKHARSRLIRDRLSSNSPQSSQGKMPAIDDIIGPLTIVPARMTDTKIDRAIDDAKRAEKEILIRGENGKEFKNFPSLPNTGEESCFETSELNLASNLSSSTEFETDFKLMVKLKERSVRV